MDKEIVTAKKLPEGGVVMTEAARCLNCTAAIGAGDPGYAVNYRKERRGWACSPHCRASMAAKIGNIAFGYALKKPLKEKPRRR